MYNVEKFIGKCLKSLENQTLMNIEIIIVNDGSTDNSLEIAKKCRDASQKKMIIINKNNEGQSSARNIGLKYATGKYIGFVDSDDFIEKNMYEYLYKIAVKDDLDVIQCSYINWYEGNPQKNYRYRFLKSDSEVLNGRDYFELDPAVGVCDKLFKREFLNQIKFKFHEGIFAEDALIMPKVFFLAERVKYVADPLYYYRRVNGSTTNPVTIEKSLKLGRDKIFIASELNIFKEKNEWKGNVSRIIVPNILTPFLKKQIFNKYYRQNLIQEYIEKKCTKIITSNLSLTLLIKIFNIFIFKLIKERKV